jgi:DNA-binding MarR family transcriptional regulator
MSRTDEIEQAATGLAQLSLYLRTRQWKAGEELGLTPTQITVLTLLRQRGSNRVRTLARLLGVSLATASRVISALERKELVRKTTDPADARATLVSLTPAGVRVVSSRTEFPQALLEALAGLSPLESRALHTALSKVILELQESGAIEPQRMCCTCRFFRPYRHSTESRPHHCDFVDAPFGTDSLRLDCGDHQAAEETVRKERWRRFLAATPPD